MAAFAATSIVPEFRAPSGGSSDLSFYFTAPLHTAYLAATGQSGTGTAGWYRVFRDLAGGEIGPDVESAPVYNEAKEVVAEVESKSDFLITNGVMGHNAIIVNTFEWMKGKTFKARYPLPPTETGAYKYDTDGDRYGMLYGFPSVRVKQTGRTPTGNGQQRATTFEVRAGIPDGAATAFVVADVNLDDDTAWAAKMAPYKNTPA